MLDANSSVLLSSEQEQEQVATNSKETKTTNSRRRVKVELQEADGAQLGMSRLYAKGIDGKTACTFFAGKQAADGFGVRRLGGQAPSAYTSSRGAAGALNGALLDACHKGVKIADLLDVTRANCLGRNGVAADPMDKLAAHLKSFVIQADPKRAAANGLVRALANNGWTWRELADKAVLFDGKSWDGTLFKRSVTSGTRVLCPILVALHYKRTATLAKELGLTD